MDGILRESPGVERARWLGELAQAIDEAQRVAWNLGLSGNHGGAALDLYGRLEAAREEVEYLRGGGWRAQRYQFKSKWMQFTPAAAQPSICTAAPKTTVNSPSIEIPRSKDPALAPAIRKSPRRRD